MNKPEHPAEPSMEEILASIRRAIDEDQRLDARLSRPAAEPPATPAPGPAAVPDAQEAHPEATPPGERVLRLRRPSDGEPWGQGAGEAQPLSASHFSATFPSTGEAGREADVAPGRETGAPAPYGTPANDSMATAPSAIGDKAPGAADLPDDDAAGMPENAASPAETTAAPADARAEEDEMAETDTMTVQDERLIAAETESAVWDAFGELSDRLGDEMLREEARALLRPMLKEWLDHNLPGLVETLVRQEIERISQRIAERRTR